MTRGKTARNSWRNRCVARRGGQYRATWVSRYLVTDKTSRVSSLLGPVTATSPAAASHTPAHSLRAQYVARFPGRLIISILLATPCMVEFAAGPDQVSAQAPGQQSLIAGTGTVRFNSLEAGFFE